MNIKYEAPDFEINKIVLSKDILGVSDPEESTPETGGDAPRDGSEFENIFG